MGTGRSARVLTSAEELRRDRLLIERSKDSGKHADEKEGAIMCTKQIGVLTAAILVFGIAGLAPATEKADGYPILAQEQTRDQFRDGTGDGVPDQIRDRDRLKDRTGTYAMDQALDRTQARDRLKDGTGDGVPDQLRAREHDRSHDRMGSGAGSMGGGGMGRGMGGSRR